MCDSRLHQIRVVIYANYNDRARKPKSEIVARLEEAAGKASYLKNIQNYKTQGSNLRHSIIDFDT